MANSELNRPLEESKSLNSAIFYRGRLGLWRRCEQFNVRRRGFFTHDCVNAASGRGLVWVTQRCEPWPLVTTSALKIRTLTPELRRFDTAVCGLVKRHAMRTRADSQKAPVRLLCDGTCVCCIEPVAAGIVFKCPDPFHPAQKERREGPLCAGDQSAPCSAATVNRRNAYEGFGEVARRASAARDRWRIHQARPTAGSGATEWRGRGFRRVSHRFVGVRRSQNNQG